MSPPEAPLRVVVVDGDPDYRLVVRLALESHPRFEVVGEAGDGAEAVDVARRIRPDLVLLDCSLPPADAFASLPEIREAAHSARVVLISGHDESELRLASNAAGTLGWLTKDTPARQLGTELEALMGLVEAVRAVLDEARTRLSDELTSARAARQFVREALQRWELDELTDTVTLLVSELVTNAVVHARSDVEVLVSLTTETARVEVTDTSQVVPVAKTSTDFDATSGRGLAMVDAMARRWGVRTGPAGKTVWFEIDR